MTTLTNSADSRILSTLNEDGSRRWLRPRVSPGRFLKGRRIVAYSLIAIFAAIPYITINDKPAILLDIVNREFTFFGATFLPTDTLLLALFMVSVFLTIFLVTSLFGRVWCGWACPQTVYLEFVYRPIERLLDGKPGRIKKRFNHPGLRNVAKYAINLLISMFAAHVFLAYFVGIEALATWVTQSPFEHPISFGVMAVVTGLMMFDFAFFREQVCIVACPYGRFQSVMLDRNSLIVSYDPERGEPRGKFRRKKKAAKTPETPQADLSLRVVGKDTDPEPGDCVDCRMCVDTCPTGIDIREGLQMECVGCAQCIDACDAVMKKVGRQPGLIRYSTQAAIEGEKSRILRPRVVLYSVALTIVLSLFITTLATRQPADVTLLRGVGFPYVVLPGENAVSNEVRVKIVNRTREPKTYAISLAGLEGARFVAEESVPVRVDVGPGDSETRSVRIAAPRNAFTGGEAMIQLQLTDGADYSQTLEYQLLGPSGLPQAEGGGS